MHPRIVNLAVGFVALALLSPLAGPTSAQEHDHDHGPTLPAGQKRFGFQRKMEPYLSLALGASESTLVEITSAYSSFANGGVRMTPYSIISVSDREGNLLEENASSPNQVTRADTAFVMTHLLQGVIKRGTGSAASRLEWPLAGKTGTTDEYTDAWFVGFDPDITVGVWVGHDKKKSLGKGETGASDRPDRLENSISDEVALPLSNSANSSPSPREIQNSFSDSQYRTAIFNLIW